MNRNELNKFNSIGYENFSDQYIFNPLSDFLIPIFRFFNFTPNQITSLSAIFNLSSLCFYINNYLYCSSILYFIGYLLDCVDGRYARKYNLGSTYGMMLDQVTDVVTNTPFNIIILSSKLYRGDIISFILIVLVTDLLMISFSLEEAYSCIEKNNHDDFYNYKKLLILDNQDDSYIILYNIFLLINKNIHDKYIKFIDNQDYKHNANIFIKKNIIEESFKYFIEFGTGNYCMFIIFMILN